ncbi:hypothetical protein EKO04_005824 [Ascochyta lentis]|uniref:Uncharacterized protein n=1 Tax=Ascochyta lentis TaxID=205686 RepID=A0A8H7IZZ5_9PLEO|nr:hypothetical protein EKO04_005824 [Ascochyta lentis]
MRLLIESRNRWTIELASCKHDKLGRPSAHTFVSNNLIQDKNVDWPDNTDNATPTKASDSSVYRYTQLPRRKSIHKRIGRFFLRVSRMHSDAQYDAYAYEYGLGASELPAGGSPIEGSTSFQEMPGSFPPDGIFELEDEHYSMSTSYAQTAPEHLRDYFKSNQNATMRRPAPVDARSFFGHAITNLSHNASAKRNRRSKSKSKLAAFPGHYLALRKSKASPDICSLWIVGAVRASLPSNTFDHRFFLRVK